MKITVSFIMAFILSFGLSAQGIEFFKGTFAEAQEEAAKQGKLIFMDAYASWCGPCKRMAKDVFPQASVGNYFNENFINLKIDMEKGEGKDLRKKYGVSAYPTLFFLNPDGSVALSQRGAQSAQGLLNLGKKALVPNEASVKKMKAEYENGKRDADFLYQYINTLNKLGEDFTEPFNSYLSNLSEEELSNEKNLQLIYNNTNSINSAGYPYFTDNAKSIKAIYGEEDYQNKLSRVATGTIDNAIENKDEALMLSGVKLLKKAKVDNVKEKMAFEKVRFYGKTQDWDNYASNVNKYIKKYKKGDAKTLNDVAWNYYMFVDEPKQLNAALEWAEQAIAIDNSYQNNLTHAYLLYKLERYSEAQDAVEYALILSKDDKVNTKNAEIIKSRIESALEAE